MNNPSACLLESGYLGSWRLANNISSALVSDLHGHGSQPGAVTATIDRERSDHTLGSVCILTIRISIAHRTQSGLGTGLRHLASHQSDTVRHRYFVVVVASVGVE